MSGDGLPHGRVPLARPGRATSRPGRVGHVRDRPPPAAAAAACRSRTSSTARRWTRSGPSPGSAGGGPVVADGAADDADAAGRLHRQRRARLQRAARRPRRTASGRPRPRSHTTALDANGEQAGIVVWKSENPNTFSKVHGDPLEPGALPVRAHRHPERVGEPADRRRASRRRRTARCRRRTCCVRPARTGRTSSASSRSTTASTGSRSATPSHVARPFTGRAEDRRGRVPRRLAAAAPPSFDCVPRACRARRAERRRSTCAHGRARRSRISSTAPTLDPKWARREPGRRLRRRRWPAAT